MPSANTPIDEKNWHYSYHAVAFIDILGQKDAFKQIVKVPTDPEGHQRLIKALKDTVGFVEFLRNGFKDCFATYSKSAGGEDRVPQQFREEYLRLKKNDISLYGLSDSVVAWTPLMASDNHCAAMNSIYGILMASAGMFILSLAAKHAIRGGIEIDGGIKLAPESIEIYGPALFKAVTLEGYVAKHPRIVIGQGMLDFLATVSAGTSTERTAVYARQIARLCREMIVQDSDGYFILDYLGKLILATSSRALPKNEVLVPAKRFIESELVRWEAQDNPELAARYRKVLAYFNVRLPDL